MRSVHGQVTHICLRQQCMNIDIVSSHSKFVYDKILRKKTYFIAHCFGFETSDTIVISLIPSPKKTIGPTAYTGCYRPRSFVSHVSWLGSLVVMKDLNYFLTSPIEHPKSCTGGSSVALFVCIISCTFSPTPK